VLDGELTPPLEQVEQADLSVRAVELVVLVDPDHREPATLCVECVALACQSLLLHEELLPGVLPLIAGNDFGQAHT
jgi:hypothetical protein